jgi:hypothetical protein
MTYSPSTNPSYSSSGGDCSSPSVFLFAWMMILALAFGRVLTGITLSLFETPELRLVPFFMAAGQSVLLVLLLAVPALRWANPIYRAVFRSWVMAAIFPGLASFIHLTRPYEFQLQAALHILAAAVFSLLVWLLAGRPQPARPARSQARLWAMVGLFAALLAYPWLAWGALGSPTDTFLQLLAALFLGLASALILELHLFPALIPAGSQPEGRPKTSNFFAGLAAGTVLLLIFSGAAFGYHVLQLLLMLALPGLGFLLVGLARLAPGAENIPPESPSLRQDRLLPLAALVGLAAAGPMLLIDPVDLYLLASLSEGEILQWGLTSALVSGLAGLALGVLLHQWTRPAAVPPDPIQAEAAVNAPAPSGSQRRLSWAAPLLAAAVLGGGLIYFLVGQPGFHGDTLFVILKDQAVLSQVPLDADAPTRRQEVYSQLVQHAQSSQAGLRAEVDRFNVPYKPFYLVNALEVQGGPLLRVWLASRPEVDRVLHNPWMRPLPAERPLSTGEAALENGPAWNLTLIRAPQAWETFGAAGEGIIIGQSDSGVDWTHPELAQSYRGRNASHDYNWFDPWYETLEPVDVGGHGTHTLGSIVGLNTGVAPAAEWFGCANLVRNLGNPAVYLECMQFMLAPFPLNGDPFLNGDPARGANVINNSWSCPEVEGCDAGSLLPAVQALRAAGIFIVVSAGNDGPTCETINKPPALYAEVFSVGAVEESGRLAFFSSLGPVTADESGRVKPDILAPGADVLSAMPGGTYGRLSGTSMAGPHVAGVVALMWSANPDLIGQIEQTERLLAESAQPYNHTLPQCPGAENMPSTAVGYGLIDAYEAVRLAVEGR